MQELWKSRGDNYSTAINYVIGRRKGEITSMKTPWKRMDDAGTDGIDWHSLVIIAGRPGTGKTMFVDQIIREARVKNPNDDIHILTFQLEMHPVSSIIREFTSVIKKSYKYVNSAGLDAYLMPNKISDEEIEKLRIYSEKMIGNPIYEISDSVTVDQIVEQVEFFMEKNSTTNKEGVKIYKKTLISLDHSFLVKVGPSTRTKFDMLYDLGEATARLKRKYPIIFIILSQLNRTVEEPSRCENGKHGNYILDTDIYGSDSLVQFADFVFGLNRPATRSIKYFGPDKYLIAGPNVVVLHTLKCRNGDLRMSFFEAVWDGLMFVETPPPQSFGANAKIPNEIASEFGYSESRNDNPF